METDQRWRRRFLARQQIVKQSARELGRDEYFPAEFALVGYSLRPCINTPDLNVPEGAEREALIGQVGLDKPGQEISRTRPHQADRRLAGRDVGNRHARILRNMAP